MPVFIKYPLATQSQGPAVVVLKPMLCRYLRTTEVGAGPLVFRNSMADKAARPLGSLVFCDSVVFDSVVCESVVSVGVDQLHGRSAFRRSCVVSYSSSMVECL